MFVSVKRARPGYRAKKQPNQPDGNNNIEGDNMKMCPFITLVLNAVYRSPELGRLIELNEDHSMDETMIRFGVGFVEKSC